MNNLIFMKKFDYDPIKMKQGNSFNGRILHLDLSNESISVEEPDNNFYRKYIGGRGMVLYYLHKEMKADVDALDSDNVLIFAPGILTGTILPGTGRHGVGAKSPLTNALASGEAGGWWGSELKKAGFDGVLIKGKSKCPVYLWIHDGEVEIRNADHLWGKLTDETDKLIHEELGGDPKIRISTIGPAGENLVRYASIINDLNRTAGRSGLGAVMGSKNLKAIAVRGSASPGLENKSLMQQLMRWITGNYKELMGWAVEAGTSGSVKFLHDIGSTPIHNFQDGVFGNIEKLDAENFFEFLLVGRDTCNHCPVRCKIVVENNDKKLEISRVYGGPEYESIGALGTMCMISNPVIVAKANAECAAYGLDTISTGGTIAFTMECVEKGILTSTQEFTFLPSFGNEKDLLQSIKYIAYKEGIGKLMAEGSAKMANLIGKGAEEFIVTAKGQEFPAHDPRFRNATGLGYALSPTGADHMHNMNDFHANNPSTDTCARLREVGIATPLPLFGLPDEKVRAFSYELAFKHFSDSAVFCQFYPYEYHHMVDAVKAATGWDITIDEIVDIGKRIATMARLFLIREGFDSIDDKLPPRMKEPHEIGPIAGRIVDDDELRKAVNYHYQFMGWNEQGFPRQEEISRLSLNWINK